MCHAGRLKFRRKAGNVDVGRGVGTAAGTAAAATKGPSGSGLGSAVIGTGDVGMNAAGIRALGGIGGLGVLANLGGIGGVNTAGLGLNPSMHRLGQQQQR